LTAQGVHASGVQRFGDTNSVAVRLEAQPTEAANQVVVSKVRTALEQAQPGTRVVRTDAVGASVSLILDITKAIGFLALTRLQFDLVMIGALLTILGYSTNDKVVVYDR